MKFLATISSLLEICNHLLELWNIATLFSQLFSRWCTGCNIFFCDT